MNDLLKQLSRKGDVTVLKRPGKRTAVAIKTEAGVMSLEARVTEEELLRELTRLCSNWPNIRE
jgi:hypothetical protein